MKSVKQVSNYLFLIGINFLFCLSASKAEAVNLFSHSTTFNSSLGNIKNYFALSLSYDVTNFRSDRSGVAKPTVNTKGGVFSYVRVNDGLSGGLCMNTVNGWISFNSSQPGKYIVTYTLNGQRASVTIIVD